MNTKLFWKLLLGFALVNVVMFELFGSSSGLVAKELQFIKFVDSTSLKALHWVAAYIHRKTPLLADAPYVDPNHDSRLSTWNVNPHQMVVEWLYFTSMFVATLAWGKPNTVVPKPTAPFSRNIKIMLYVLFQLSLWTLMAIVYYKFRAWVLLNEWFAPIYLLQPCHLILGVYVWFIHDLLSTGRITVSHARIFHVLFDLQWFTYVALLLPDMDALIERNFFAEYTLFFVEHYLILALPLTLFATLFLEARHLTWKDRLYRAWYSLTWFGLHHIQVMTPASLVSGIQINYQTHLPKFVHFQFGTLYKPIITSLYFVVILIFAFAVEPMLRTVVRIAKRKLATKKYI